MKIGNVYELRPKKMTTLAHFRVIKSSEVVVDSWVNKTSDYDKGDHLSLPVSYQQLTLVSFHHDHDSSNLNPIVIVTHYNLSLTLTKLFLSLNLCRLTVVYKMYICLNVSFWGAIRNNPFWCLI